MWRNWNSYALLMGNPTHPNLGTWMGREDARISSFFFKNICRWFKLRSLFRAFNQADFVKSASRAVSMLLCCHVTQQLPWRLSAVSGLSISWTCIWQVKFVSLGKELWGFLFFFLSSWRNFLGSCPLLPPPPFQPGKTFPHCGLESEKGCFIFSGDL